ncbi:HipA family kinase [Bacillus dakarensis]|uniref:HipA family kinase n=1 Tax=Robertmurraya dakarensis TaxID=1926278 RepID=UPI000981C187|nr:HipA family kinase [Bacillus dakarensis]
MIKPVAYRRKMEGKSNAHLITFDDGRDYVVKYFRPGFEKTLPNEWISYCLGRYLGLPIPVAKIVKIPQEFSSQIPDLPPLKDDSYQFASLFIPNCLDGHQVTDVESITNPSTLASIILFDYWLGNTDRTRKNILLEEKGADSYQLWTIDHAEVFSTYNWEMPDLDSLPERVMKSAAHQLMARFIRNEEDFHASLEIIQTIPILLIEEIVALIPDDWNVTAEERKGIVTVLLRRRDKILPKLMGSFLKKVYRPLHQKNDNS